MKGKTYSMNTIKQKKYKEAIHRKEKEVEETISRIMGIVCTIILTVFIIGSFVCIMVALYVLLQIIMSSTGA